MEAHDLFTNTEGRYECRKCSQTWKGEPRSVCPGVKIYGWGEWGDLLTRKQLADAGCNTGAKLPKPAGAVHRDKSPDGIMWLYDARDAVKRTPAGEAQKIALEKAQHQAQVIGLDCARCRQSIDHRLTRKQAEPRAGELCEHCNDRRNSIEHSRELLAGCVILDSETTGLNTRLDEMVQLSIINHYGEPLINTYIKPGEHALERMYMRGSGGRSAFDIHGISREMLADAPTWAQVYPKLRLILRDKVLVVYNLDYDYDMFLNLSKDLPAIPLRDSTCAMWMYAAFVGKIRYERGRRWNERSWSYRWQKLPGGDHSALGDCLATLNIIKRMAASREFDK